MDVHEVEISAAPQLSSEQERITDLHSIFNIMNVVTGELSLMTGIEPTSQPEVLRLQEQLLVIEEAFRSGQEEPNPLQELDRLCVPIVQEMESALRHVQTPEDRNELLISQQNLLSVFRILKQRLVEFDCEERHNDVWIHMPVAVLEQRLTDVFQAISANSRGRFSVSFNLAHRNPEAYYIDLKVDTDPKQDLVIPMRFQDIVRDLAANARKYNAPGGRISVAIFQDHAGLRCLIEDDGIGIPRHELESVVGFGVRGSNVGEIRSLGGGVGLTKAVWLVKQWGGRFWIASDPGQGTRIRFYLPHPQVGAGQDVVSKNWTI